MPVQTSAAEVVRRFYAALGDRDMEAANTRWTSSGPDAVAKTTAWRASSIAQPNQLGSA
jgi:limonene-1,2-epoxide hydrolase